MITYKVLELSPVDESSLQEALNTWVPQGWIFERLEFVQQEGVRRPVMAYIFLVRKAEDEAQERSTPAPSDASDVDDADADTAGAQ